MKQRMTKIFDCIATDKMFVAVKDEKEDGEGDF